MPSAGVATPVCSQRNKLPAMACSGSMKTISQTVQVRKTRRMRRLYLSQEIQPAMLCKAQPERLGHRTAPDVQPSSKAYCSVSTSAWL